MEYLLILGGAVGVGVIWARGIDYMYTHHPDYRGEDLFDE